MRREPADIAFAQHRGGVATGARRAALLERVSLVQRIDVRLAGDGTLRRRCLSKSDSRTSSSDFLDIITSDLVIPSSRLGESLSKRLHEFSTRQGVASVADRSCSRYTIREARTPTQQKLCETQLDSPACHARRRAVEGTEGTPAVHLQPVPPLLISQASCHGFRRARGLMLCQPCMCRDSGHCDYLPNLP